MAKKSKVNDGLKCKRCDQLKNAKDFPTNRFIKNQFQKELYCRKCKKEYISDLDKLINYLEQHNLKYSQETMNVAIKSTEKQDWTKKTKDEKWTYTVGRYFATMQLGGQEPEYIDVKEEKAEEQKVVDVPSDFEVTPEIVKKWGKGYKHDEYELFEEKYNKLKNNYKLPTESHREFLMKACVCSVKADVAMAKGETKEAKEWMTMFKDVTSAGKLQPSQMSKADLSGGMDTFGQLSRMVEEAVDVVKILPSFKEKPKDKADFNIWAWANYVRSLMDMPMCEYKEIYEFYNQRIKDFEESGSHLMDEEGDF